MEIDWKLFLVFIVIIAAVFSLIYVNIKLLKQQEEEQERQDQKLEQPFHKICICMNHTPNIFSYSKLAEKINREYANAHNYDFQIFEYNMSDRAPQWCKIQVINELLATNKYSYLFWIDADAFFNKHEIPLEEFITPGKNIIVCDDIVNSGKPDTLNSGTFFVKCNKWSKKFFKQLWDYKGEYLYKYFHEQTILEHYLKNNLMNARKYIKVEPATLFNTEITVQLKDNSIHDNFIIHLMAMPADFREKFMKKWLEQVVERNAPVLENRLPS